MTRMSRGLLISTLAALGLFTLACGGLGGGSAPLTAADATQAGQIATAIVADPGAKASILQQHDLDQATFEHQLYEIAADPTLSEAYNQALQP